MDTPIRYLKEGGQGEIVEKRSRFIATLCPVSTEEEAQAFIEQTKKRYWDARHNCSAFVIGDNAEMTRCSDDGEPAHTAGRPMLDALLASGVRNVCVVVTRYFGGILLGTGGLVRAYRDAVTEGLANCVIAEKRVGVPVDVITDYTGIGKLLFLAGNGSYPILSTDYGEQVSVSLILPPAEVEHFLSELRDATSGKAQFDVKDPVTYAVNGGSCELL
ncbi:MAG: YigZ family protein [Lachnospiraceae bacterium]|nr:YigZ family protein [Lachnospiraceae bacterium]